LLDENEAKNKILAEHSDLVREYNETIARFNTELLSLKQDSYLTKVDVTEVESKATNATDESELLDARAGFQGTNIKRLEDLLAQMKIDFEASDSHY